MNIEEAKEYLKMRCEKYKANKELMGLAEYIYGAKAVKEYDKKQESIESVLKELENKDTTIKELRNRIEFQSKDITKAVNYTFELNAEVEKQKNVIEEMAKLIGDKVGSRIAICPNMNCISKTKPCKDCAKEFFYKKVEEGK